MAGEVKKESPYVVSKDIVRRIDSLHSFQNWVNSYVTTEIQELLRGRGHNSEEVKDSLHYHVDDMFRAYFYDSKEDTK